MIFILEYLMYHNFLSNVTLLKKLSLDIFFSRVKPHFLMLKTAYLFILICLFYVKPKKYRSNTRQDYILIPIYTFCCLIFFYGYGGIYFINVIIYPLSILSMFFVANYLTSFLNKKLEEKEIFGVSNEKQMKHLKFEWYTWCSLCRTTYCCNWRNWCRKISQFS